MVRLNRSHGSKERRSTRGGLNGPTAIEYAKEYLRQMTGCACEMVSVLNRTDDGWTVTLEVLELERIPRTTDILGSYVVELDGEGDLARCERIRRYYRSQIDAVE